MMPRCPRSLKSCAIRVTFNVSIAQRMWEVDLGNIKCFTLNVTQKWMQIKIGPQRIFLRWSTVLKLRPAIPSFTLWTKGWMYLPTVIWGQSCTPLPVAFSSTKDFHVKNVVHSGGSPLPTTGCWKQQPLFLSANRSWAREAVAEVFLPLRYCDSILWICVAEI